MTQQAILPRLALSLALGLSAASLVAFAADASETTDIEVIAGGVSEKISIDDLAIGETRQLYSEAGTLVTATRTRDTLELDIGGDRTSIRMIEPGAIDDAGIAALIEAHGAKAGEGKRIVHIHRDARDVDVDVRTGHKVVLVKSGEVEVHDLDAGAEALVLKHSGEPGAKQVIVKRRVERSEGGDAK